MEEDKVLHQVKKIIQDVWNDGLIQRGSGHCVAMSDIIHKLLLHHGIESYLQECSLMIYKTNMDDLVLIGYSLADVSNKVNQVKTHVVCITKTKTPILIDLSVYGSVEGVPYICEYLEKDSLIDKFTFPNGKFIYTKKYTDYQLPLLHERSITERITTDNQIFKNIKYIKLSLLVVFFITFLNAFRGFVDFYYTFLHPQNHPTRELRIKK